MARRGRRRATIMRADTEAIQIIKGPQKDETGDNKESVCVFVCVCAYGCVCVCARSCFFVSVAHSDIHITILPHE